MSGLSRTPGAHRERRMLRNSLSAKSLSPGATSEYPSGDYGTAAGSASADDDSHLLQLVAQLLRPAVQLLLQMLPQLLGVRGLLLFDVGFPVPHQVIHDPRQLVRRRLPEVLRPATRALKEPYPDWMPRRSSSSGLFRPLTCAFFRCRDIMENVPGPRCRPSGAEGAWVTSTYRA